MCIAATIQITFQFLPFDIYKYVVGITHHQNFI